MPGEDAMKLSFQPPEEDDPRDDDQRLSEVAGDDDGDLQTRYDMLKSWLAEADASNDRLKKHLHNVLEIACTWQPGYATKMDRDTLALAAQAIGYEPPNTNGNRPAPEGETR